MDHPVSCRGGDERVPPSGEPDTQLLEKKVSYLGLVYSNLEKLSENPAGIWRSYLPTAYLFCKL